MNKLLKGAITTGIINAIINGAIQYFLLKGTTPIPISVDSVTNNVHTVLGTAVPLAVSLARILPVVSYFSTKEEKVPFFPSGVLVLLKHGFFTFGVVTALSAVRQRIVRTIDISLLCAVVMICFIVGIISGIIEYLSLNAVMINSD